MVIDAVCTDSHNLGTGLDEFIVESFKAPRFDRAAPGEITGIEINCQPASPEIRCRPAGAIRFGLAGAGQIEIGNSLSRFQNNTPKG